MFPSASDLSSFPRFRVSAFPRFRVSSFPSSRVSAFPRFLVSSFPRFLVSSFPRFLVSSFPVLDYVLFPVPFPVSDYVSFPVPFPVSDSSRQRLPLVLAMLPRGVALYRRQRLITDSHSARPRRVRSCRSRPRPVTLAQTLSWRMPPLWIPAVPTTCAITKPASH